MTFEYEKSKIAAQSATDNASSQSHIVLKNTFDPLVTDPAAESKADYAKIAEGWEYSVQIFAARIKRSSESAWSGTAATTAQQSISDYATDALNLTPALRELSTRVDEALTAVINTKRDIVPYSDDPQSWWNPGDWFDGNPEADAEELARKVVQEKYINPIAQTDHSIPVLPIPKDPTNPSGDPGGTPGSGTPSTGSPSTGSPTTGTPTGTTPLPRTRIPTIRRRIRSPAVTPRRPTIRRPVPRRRAHRRERTRPGRTPRPPTSPPPTSRRPTAPPVPRERARRARAAPVRAARPAPPRVRADRLPVPRHPRGPAAEVVGAAANRPAPAADATARRVWAAWVTVVAKAMTTTSTRSRTI